MANKVTVYSTSICPYCIRLKEFLRQNNIKFEDIDVGSNPALSKEMIEKSEQMGVPVLDIDGKIIIGFDKSAISKALGI